MRHLTTGSLLALLVGTTGCVSMAPRVTLPEVPAPRAWPQDASRPAADLAWPDFYQDARLRQVLDLALQNNRDLRVAALATQRTRELYRIQRAELLPAVHAVGTGAKQRLPGSVSGTGQSRVVEQDAVQVGITAWELDLFGRVRSLKNRALSQYLATEQAQRGARIALLAEVANLYLTLGADQESLALAKATLASQEATSKLVQRRFELGATAELDARRAQVGLETARVEAARYTQVVAMDLNALTLLVGAPIPADLLPTTLAPATALKDVPPGLPSDVLARRPDIRAAEHQLRAAHANIGAARAAFFPRIALTTSFGTMADEVSGLFQSGSRAWAFAPQVSLPIFDSGSRWAALKVAQADRDIAVAQYEKAIQVAFREVADGLAARGTLDEQVAAQTALTQALERTHSLALARFQAGLDGYLSVLDAQRSLYGAQQGLIALRRSSFGNLVTLYKVLGGGDAPPASGAAQ